MANKKITKVRDLKPNKDAKGGGGVHIASGGHGPSHAQGGHGPSHTQTAKGGGGGTRPGGG